MVGGILISLLLICYIVWSYRPPRPDLLDYQYGGTHCDIQWSCPTDQEQYKCHVLPPSIAQRLPIKHYLVQVLNQSIMRLLKLNIFFFSSSTYVFIQVHNLFDENSKLIKNKFLLDLNFWNI